MLFPGIECWPQCQARAWSARSRAGLSGAVSHGLALSPFAASKTAPSVFPLTSCTSEVTTPQVTFGCLAKGYFPEPVTVTWSPNVGSSGVRTYPSMLQPSSGLYSLSSQVIVPASSWESNTYRCTVEHQPTSSSISKEIPTPGQALHINPQPCTPCPDSCTPSHTHQTGTLAPPPPHSQQFSKETTSPGNIQVFLVPPSPAALYVAQSPMLTCLVVNLPRNSSIQVVWSREKPGSIVPEPLTLTEQFNSTITASSSMPIFTRDWESAETFTCKVEHSELPSPLIKSISKKPGRRSGPGIYLLRPHNEELSNSEDSASLTCLVQGFFPEDISVQWMKNHKPNESLEYITTQPFKDGAGDSNFFLYSKLKVSKASWNSGDIYTCMVIHEALSMKFTQRSVSKVSGK
uniref:Ig-like domain-containing protein n=1 Tax=Gopherus evgoodei TaxID=1825980 RepID=A0A8C4YTA3_9SAUR